MAKIYWQTQKLHDGETASFDFSGVPDLADGIAGFLAGIAGFQLAFDGYHHRVREAGVVLDANLSGEKLVQVSAHLHFDSDTGDRASPEKSWVFVTVVVWDVGDAVFLDGAPHLPATLTSSPETVETANAALSAFWFGFDHGQGQELSEIDVSLDVVPGEGTIEVDGAGVMQGADSTGATLQLGAAVVATSPASGSTGSISAESPRADSAIPFEIQVTPPFDDDGATDCGRSNRQTTASFTGPAPIATATALLTSFDIAFDGGMSREVETLVAGAMTYDNTAEKYVFEAPQIRDHEVVVTTNLSMVRDCDNTNHQSTVNQGTFLVIASRDADSEVAAPAGTGQSPLNP